MAAALVKQQVLPCKVITENMISQSYIDCANLSICHNQLGQCLFVTWVDS